MKTRFSLCRALRLGVSILPFLAACPALATNYSINTTVITRVNGNANVGVNTAGSHTDSTGKPYNPTVNFNSPANVTGELDIYNHSTAALATGAAITMAVYAHDTSIFNMNGGTVGTPGQAGMFSSDVYAQDGSTVNINGGAIYGQLSSISTLSTAISTINYSGGSVGRNLYAQGTGLFNINGTNLTATFQTVDSLNNNVYQLSGLLNDGKTSVNGDLLYVQNGTGASFTFNGQAPKIITPTPAPNSLVVVLLGFAGAGLRFSRRAKK